MGSLTDLNNYSEGTVAIIDQREPGPRFNFDDPQDDFTQIATTGSIAIYRDQLEILDVVRPDIAQLEFIVDVSGVAGVTVDFPDILDDIVEEVNGVYTLRYITQKSDWDIAKTATIEIPNTFQGSFFYEVKLRWFDGTAIQELDWEVGQFVPVSNFNSSFEIDIEGKYVKVGFSNLQVATNLTQVDEYAQIIGVFSLNIIAEDLDLAASNLDATFDLTFPLYNPLLGFDSLSFGANQKNSNIFENASIVETPLGTGIDQYQISLSTSDLSEFYDDSETKVYAWTGTLSEVNTYLRTIDYYPVPNNFSTITFQVIVQQYNGSTYDVIARDRYILPWDGTSTGISTRVFEYAGNVTPNIDFYPTLEDQKYGLIDICVVGGGGGAAVLNVGTSFGSAGGGGGGVLASTNKDVPAWLQIDAGTGGAVGSAGTFSRLVFRQLDGTLLASYVSTGGSAGVTGTSGYGGTSGYSSALTDVRDDYEEAPTTQNFSTKSGANNDNNINSGDYGRTGGGGGAGGTGGISLELPVVGGGTATFFYEGRGGKSAKPIWLNNFYGGGGGGGDLNFYGSAPYNTGGYQSGGNGAYRISGTGQIINSTLPTSYGGGGGGGFIDYADGESSPSRPGAPGAVIFRIKPR